VEGNDLTRRKPKPVVGGALAPKPLIYRYATGHGLRGDRCGHEDYALCLHHRFAIQHGLRPRNLCAARTGSPCHFSVGIHANRPYFSSTAKKSRQKKPLSGIALFPSYL
ncbi:MAG: hypothetical protein NWQ26_03950, partial [Paraglaciecola sp.]|nr:hypothetical protein [Paraglaciecola sp.]